MGRVISQTSPTGYVTSFRTQKNITQCTVTVKTAAFSVGYLTSNVGIGRRDIVIKTEPGYTFDLINIIQGE